MYRRGRNGVIEAFPRDTAPKYLLRDRDGIYGDTFKRRVTNMGIEEVMTAHHCPRQNSYSERLNGSIRRECLDQVIIFSEAHLRRVLKEYFEYYNHYRIHQSLEVDAPEGRKIHTLEEGNVMSSRRGASKLQDEVCFLCLPPGFPAVPRYFVHTGLSHPPLSEPCLRYLRTRLLTLPFTRNHNKSTCTGGLGRANMLTRMRGRGSGNRFSIRMSFSQVMPFL